MLSSASATKGHRRRMNFAVSMNSRIAIVFLFSVFIISNYCVLHISSIVLVQIIVIQGSLSLLTKVVRIFMQNAEEAENKLIFEIKTLIFDKQNRITIIFAKYKLQKRVIIQL